MSERFVKVNDVETVESSNSTALIVLFVTVIAVVVIGLMFWQPWAAAQPQSSTTTIIHEGQTPAPNNQPIIVNPPPRSISTTIFQSRMLRKRARLAIMTLETMTRRTQQTTRRFAQGFLGILARKLQKTISAELEPGHASNTD